MDDPAKLQSELLLREYDSLRQEILQRLGTAYSHLGYFGTLVAIAAGVGKDANWNCFTGLVGLLGLSILLWIFWNNWNWLRRCAEQVREIEGRVNGLNGSTNLLTWESKVLLMTRGVFIPPRGFVTYDAPKLISGASEQESAKAE